MKTRKGLLLTLGGISLTAALTLSGCGAVEGALEAIQGDQVEGALSTEAPEPVWRAEIQHATPQVAISQNANVAVTYFIKDEALMLGGFDLKDGSELWAYPANTGSQTNSYPLKIRTLVDNGESFVLNILDPVDGPADDSGRFDRSHPLQIINIASGEVAATTEPEYWVGTWATVCLDEKKACVPARNGDVVSTLSVSSRGEVSVDEAVSVFPGYAFIDRVDDDGTFIGETKEGVPTFGLFRDNEIKWSRPISDLGVSDLRRSDSRVGYEDLNIVTSFFNKDGTEVVGQGESDVLTIASRMIDVAPMKDSVGHFSTLALDTKTGETLWEAEGTPCLNGVAVMCSGESTIQEKQGRWDYLPSTQAVWRFEPMTGKKIWETEVEKLTLLDNEGWEVPRGSSIQVIAVGNDHKLIDLEDGTLSAPTAEQVFRCEVSGPDYKAYERSIPAEGKITWTGNKSTVGCGVESNDIPVSGFSKAVAVTGSPRPFDASEDWDVWDKQVRVVSTMDGLVAYEF